MFFAYNCTLIVVFYCISETFAFRVTARLEDPKPVTSQHPCCLFEYFSWCVLLIYDVSNKNKLNRSNRSSLSLIAFKFKIYLIHHLKVVFIEMYSCALQRKVLFQLVISLPIMALIMLKKFNKAFRTTFKTNVRFVFDRK